MPDRDDRLEAELADLGGALAWPRPAPGFALVVRARIEASPRGARPFWARPVRRSLLIAVALLLVAATVAVAVGLGLPGIRILFGPPPVATPSATVRPSGPVASLAPGAALRLGQRVDVADLADLATFPVLLPTDPFLGPPDAAWIDGTRAGQVSLVWRSRPDLPATLEPDIGLVLGQFNGRLSDSYITKTIDTGTTVERVRVGDDQGFWITGVPHFFFYEDADGHVVEDSRRWVGDALLWTDGTMTYRIETSLGRDAAIRIAESLR